MKFNVEISSRKIKRIILNQNKQLEKKFKDEKWMQILLDCQNEIIKRNPSNYYLNHYRDSEKCYWINIPQWLFKTQDIGGKVLDIGCGYGTLALYCQKVLKSEIYCIDFNASNLNESLIKERKIHFNINNIEIDIFHGMKNLML